MTHEEFIDSAKLAILAVFNDTSVDQAITTESLQELRDEIDIYLDSIRPMR